MTFAEEYLIPSCIPGDKRIYVSTKDPIKSINQRLYPELYALCKKNKTFDGPNWKKEKTKKELFDEYIESKRDY